MSGLQMESVITDLKDMFKHPFHGEDGQIRFKINYKYLI